MNPIGSFSFGRILKTFLPGFMALIGLILVLDARFYWLYGTHPVWAWANHNATAAVFATVPLSLVCGMALNTLAFTYLLDPLVRRPYQAKHPDFARLWNDLSGRLRTRTEGLCVFSNDSEPYWDLEYFLLPIVPMEKYTFLEDSYWYFMEFNLNILLALVLDGLGIVAAILAHSVRQPPGGSFPWISLILLALLMILFARALVACARKDFEKHHAKKLSLLLGSLYAKETFR